jgi:ATP-dependent exoDNAse (exonuclease V) beta subunit
MDTFHGSKGLEWPTVVLLFCHRDISVFNDPGPIFDSSTGVPRFFSGINSEHFEEFKARQRLNQEQTHARLLYVAMTRTKGTLILTHGHPETTPEANSPAALLDFDLNDLERWTVPGIVTGVQFREDLCFANEEDPADRGEAMAGDGGEKIGAVALPRRWYAPPPAKVVASTVGDEDARRHGVWWHETMEFFPWRRPDDHRAYLFGAARRAPDPQRALEEVDLFLCSEFYENLLSADWDFFPEWSFAVPDEETGEAHKSVVDLLCFNRLQNVLVVVDWKTEVLAPASVSAALTTHRPQLERYVRFFRATTPLPAGIYFTHLGRFFSMDGIVFP